MVRHQLHMPQQSHITAIFHTNIPYFPLLSLYHPHFPIFILHLPPTPPLLPFTNPSIYPTNPLFPAITYPTIYHYYPRLYPSVTPLLPNLPPPPPLAVTYPGLECELCVVVELGPRGGDQCWNLLTEISHTLVGEKFLSKQTNTTDPDIYRHDVSVFDVFIASYDVTVLPDPSECKHLLLWQPPRKRKPPLIRYTEKKIKERK